MKKYIIMISVIISILSCGFLNAQDNSIFVYDSNSKRDPFIPLVTESGKLIITYGVVNSINDVIVEGILYDEDGESVVIMNGLVLKENDQAGKVQVKKIKQDMVVLIFEGEEHTFKLKE